MAFHSKDPLGLELDVEVSENQLMALWPTFVKGTSCTVPQCEGYGPLIALIHFGSTDNVCIDRK